MKSRYIIPASLIAVLFMILTSFAAITVESVQGKVAYKSGDQWRPLAPNQSIAVGTKIITGAKSSAVLNVDGSTVTVRQLSMVRVNANIANEQGSSTNLGLKYGSVNAKVRKIKALRTNFKISTPIATSSVRGTEEEVSFGPQAGMIIQVLQGAIGTEGGLGLGNIIRGDLKFQLKTDSARPEFLLTDRQGNTLVRLFADRMTDNEKRQFERFGLDVINQPGRFRTPLDVVRAKAVFKLTWQ
ncbi:MAG: FecR domain-containing protein [Spirochaetes bacterium]|nr:FecR domain-containing protein [Spirochaetota bacterium]